MKVCAETNYDIGDIVKVNYGSYDEFRELLGLNKEAEWKQNEK